MYYLSRQFNVHPSSSLKYIFIGCQPEWIKVPPNSRAWSGRVSAVSHSQVQVPGSPCRPGRSIPLPLRLQCSEPDRPRAGGAAAQAARLRPGAAAAAAKPAWHWQALLP